MNHPTPLWSTEMLWFSKDHHICVISSCSFNILIVCWQIFLCLSYHTHHQSVLPLRDICRALVRSACIYFIHWLDVILLAKYQLNLILWKPCIHKPKTDTGDRIWGKMEETLLVRILKLSKVIIIRRYLQRCSQNLGHLGLGLCISIVW